MTLYTCTCTCNNVCSSLCTCYHIVTAGNFDCDEVNMTLSDTAMRLHGIKLALSLKVSKPDNYYFYIC